MTGDIQYIAEGVGFVFTFPPKKLFQGRGRYVIIGVDDAKRRVIFRNEKDIQREDNE